MPPAQGRRFHRLRRQLRLHSPPRTRDFWSSLQSVGWAGELKRRLVLPHPAKVRRVLTGRRLGQRPQHQIQDSCNSVERVGWAQPRGLLRHALHDRPALYHRAELNLGPGPYLRGRVVLFRLRPRPDHAWRIF